MSVRGNFGRHGLAAAALIGSIAGAAVLTLYSAWVAHVVAAMGRTDPSVRGQVIDALSRDNLALLAIIGAVLLSLGLAVNARSLRASAFGASLEARSDDPATDAARTIAAVAATAAGDSADAIAARRHD